MSAPKPEAAAVEAITPLTPLQHGMLVASLEDPEGRAYVEQLAVAFDGALDGDRLERALRDVVARHGALRTSFVWKRGDRPMQVVHASVPVALERRALEGALDVEALLAEERARGIDLARAPLSRFVLASRADGARHVLVWTHHHAILDGWSIARVLGELMEGYATGKAPSAPARPFKDYVAWLGKRRPAEAERFWRERLRGATAPTSILAALPKPAAPTSLLPTQRSRRLSADATRALMEVVRREQVTLATVVDAAWAVLAARLSGTSDVLFGVTVSGRPAELEGIETTVGLCINTIPLRTVVRAEETVSALLARLGREIAETKPYEWTPLVDAQGASEIPRGSALVEGVVVVENYPAEDLGERAPPGLSVSSIRVVEETGYPWMLVVGPGRELFLRLDADPRLVGEEAADALLAHLAALLEAIAAAPRESLVGELAAAPAGDLGAIEGAWNASGRPGLAATTPLAQVLAAAARHGERPAARDPDGTETSYAGLVARAEGFARGLVARGVRPGDRVALALARGADHLAAMLGVWRAGAAFVPVDLTHPAARVAASLEDAGVTTLVTDAAGLEAARSLTASAVVLGELAARDAVALPPPPAPSDLAYVLFTSGSTGRPKGVAVRHGGVANLLASIAELVSLAPDDVWLAVTPATFDISVLELVGPLASGACVAIASDEEAKDGVLLARKLAAARPSVLQATPSTFRLLLASGEQLALSGVRVLVGGEALTTTLARELLREAAAVWNVYGPTETTIWSTALRVDDAEADASGYVAIGRPLANTRVVVREGHGGLLGRGLVGELGILGDGLAEGYVGDPDKTRAAFVETPRGRLYRTGDRARWREDGVLVFEGRRDTQVKLRGHRIELGEIEAALEALQGVAQAAVLASEEILVAHVVGEASEEDVLAGARELLPAALVPSRVVRHEALPRTPNGKVDRLRLAALGGAREVPREGTSRETSPLEAIVVGIFAEVLKQDSIAPGDDFFALGGHSLLATQVLARLRKSLGVEVPLRDLFELRTARALARRAEARRAGGDRPPRPPLVRAGTPWEDRDAELSYAQTRLWFIDRLEPNRAFYNIPAAVRLRGPVDLARLERAFDAIVGRHAALRTTFHDREGRPVARVGAPRPVGLVVDDLSTLAAEDRPAAARARAYAEVKRPFDLTRDLLLRVLVLRLGPEDHVAVTTMHHIAADGWSAGVLVTDLVRFYDGAPPAALAIELPDFAVWQRAWLEGAGRPLDAQIASWRTALAGLAPLELPTDRPRPPVRSFRGARVPFTLDAALTRALRALARRTSSTLFMVLLAGFDALLARLTEATDLAVGTPIAARTEPELEPLVGFFANTLVLRVDVSGDPSFTELVARVQKVSLDAHENQDVPFEQLVAALAPRRDRSRSPLFDAMFVLQNAPRPLLSATGLAFEPAEAEVETAKVDVELTMMESGDELLASFEVDTDLFDVATAEGWARALVTLLRHATEAPEERISRLRTLADGEEARLLAVSTGPVRDYVVDEGLARALERTADRVPDACALVDGEGARTTYAELDRAKNRLARALVARGVKRGEPVGVAVPRSPLLVACVHACLAIGAPYVPLEPDLPRDRRLAMAEDARVRVVLTDAAGAGEWGERALDSAAAARDGALSGARLGIDVRGSDLAYVIYTSGSTGKPKGVVLEHAGVQNRLAWQQEALGLGESEAVLHKTPYGFDVSVWELLWPLRVGARLVVAAPGAHRDPRELVRLVAEHQVTTMHFVPSMLAAFLEAEGLEGLASLTRIVTSGEALSLDLVRRAHARLPRAAIHNLYGPTEASVDVTHFEAVRGPLDAVPIGKPIANTRVYVVDRAGRLAADGFPGELWLSGIQVAKGYLGDEARTVESFGEDPFSPGARVYRTGDLGRRRRDGEILFLGRRDGQIKIRGHRVELGEIEAKLREDEGVREAAVTLRATPGASEPRLVAYVVPRAPSADGEDGARADAHVAGWRDVFAGTYGEAAADPTFDLHGWTSSFDGRPIPEAEMRAWVSETVARIVASAPRRVLEIGCGTGLLLFRIAPAVERYVGLEVVDRTRARVAEEARRRGLAGVSLFTAPAHDLGCVAGTTFDAVVLNSVVQYFPDGRYLVRALEAAAERMPEGGVLFVGDVRSRALAHVFAAEVELARAPDGLPLGDLARAAATRAAEDEELLVDPRLWRALARREGGAAFAARVRDVEVRLKRGPARNELTAYRYDVAIRLAPLGESVPRVDHGAPERVDGSRFQTVREVEDALAAARRGGARAVVVHGLPNARVARAVELSARLAEGGSALRTAGDLRAALDLAAPRGIDPDALASALEGAAHVTWDPDAPGALRVIVGEVAEDDAKGPLAELASSPAHVVRAAALGRRLRERLRRALPEAMVPSAFVVLEALPLSPSGKLDRARLPEPETRAREDAEHVPPRTAAEMVVASAFAELLGTERVGRASSFFDLGGHSLLAIRLVARLAKRLGREVLLRDVFQAPTVAELAARIEGRDARAELAPVPRSSANATSAPLSFAQERLWFLEQLAPGRATYNIPSAVRIEGRLDTEALARALTALVARHVGLRVRIEDGVQHVVPAASVPLAVTDASGLPEAARREAALLACREEARAPFDLGGGLLLRARLVRLGDEDHVLALTTHHLASDRWTQEILVRDLGALYRHEVSGGDEERGLAPLPLDVLDYARWQRSPAREAELAALVERVRARLEGAPSVITLPTDRPRRVPRSPEGVRVASVVPAAVGLAVEGLAREASATAFSVFTAAFGALLARYGAGEDVVLGTATSGRTRPELEALAGMFVGTAPLRVRVPAGATLRALASATHADVLEALACEEAPFERVVEAMAPARSLAHEPVVQAMIVLQNTPRAPLDLPGARLTLLDADTGTSKLDLTLFLEPVPGEPGAYALVLEGARDLFDRETLERLATAYVRLLAGGAAAPDAAVDDVALVDAAEEAELLRLARGAEPGAEGPSVHARILARAEAEPGRVVATDGTTAGELAARVARLAEQLAARGAGPGERVAIAVPRSLEAVVAILATRVTGAAWVPVPVGTPAERARVILEDAGACLVVRSDGELEGGRRGGRGREETAYVLYTSGSSGTPKGVAVGDRALARHMEWMARAYPLAADDVVLVRTPIGFDASVWEPLAGLLEGARLAFAPEGSEADPEELAELVARERVTVMQVVPTVLAALVHAGLLGTMGTLRRIFAGGEALSAELRDAVFRALPGVALVNLYGPTEATIDATSHACGTEDGPVVPIGRPIDGARAYVLDARGRLAPRGAIGELHLAGSCLAAGYWRDEERTNARFVPDPFVPGERMYRTGDRVRLGADGALVYVGREDDQVKLGGVRIELAEVEAALAAHPGVRAAAAVVREDAGAPKRLVGYVVGEGLAPNELRAGLGARLPGAAVPAQIVVLEALPRTASGKVDRRKLPAPPALARAVDVRPEGAVEETLARVLAAVLGLAEVSADADFFELGGDSIASLALVSRARAAGLALAPRDVFEGRTVRGLAARARVADDVLRAQRAVAEGGDLPLSPAQALLEGLSPRAPHHFNQAALVEVPADFDAEALARAVVALVLRHDALRLRVVTTERGARQVVEPPSAAERIAVAATRSVALASAEEIAPLAARVQGEIDLERGPLFRVVHMALGEGAPGRVLLVVHHYAVDAVSWRVLEEDLLSAYAQARAGGAAPRLPLPSATLHDHAAWAARAAEDPAVRAEVPYWRAQTEHVAKLPRDGAVTALPEASARTTRITLGAEATRALTALAATEPGLSLDAVFLAPLLVALASWTGERAFAIALESHGRVETDLDLSRVIGWFTAIHPVRFEVDHAGVRDVARAAAEVLRRVPRAGIHHGVLAARGEVPRGLPEIGWNFLGRRARRDALGFAPAREPIGPLRSPEAERLFVLEVVAAIDEDRLEMDLVSSEGAHEAATIARLAARVEEGLVALAGGAASLAPAPAAAAVDASEADLDDEELARVLAKLGRRP